MMASGLASVRQLNEDAQVPTFAAMLSKLLLADKATMEYVGTNGWIA
jgi:hypothetical protein